MRRDNFTVDIDSKPDDDGTPTISIDYDGPSGALRERLTTTTDGTLDADEIDVAFRRQAGADSGVLSLTNRLTGEFVLEVAAAVDEMQALVTAAERRDDDGEYEVRLTDSEGKSLVYEKRTLLVYDHDGSLLRQQSLIPGGVEL
ncbi:DUF5793 family protein [Halomicroarcula sp. S1AR25-4]|uniref:DUF5793 family protein n=1 Tax=Haloarcula sp. S1AR25-4 TaxID=2950538 RepID=UPI002877196F|nr:DUF5793 family protein [Halomicroarcula sp. S1AR25-4]MDS0276858.1 DUF5793 family protein [Halomicroarcula sp. S1AR25-4]